MNLIPDKGDASARMKVLNDSIENRYRYYYSQGLNFYAKEQLDQAKDFFNKALQVKPNDTDAKGMLDKIASTPLIPNRSEGTNVVIDDPPVEPVTPSKGNREYQDAMDNGQDLLDRGRYGEAMVEFDKALKAKPGDAAAQEKIDEIRSTYRQYNQPSVVSQAFSDPIIKRVVILSNNYTKVTILFKNYKDLPITIYSSVQYPKYSFFINADGKDYQVRSVDKIGFVTKYPIPQENYEITLVFDAIPLSTKSFDLIEGKVELQDQQHWNFKGVTLK
jgi:tetratricopeptide (TPR) repeat protein